MSAVVLVFGNGVLADSVCRELGTQFGDGDDQLQIIRQHDLLAGIPEAGQGAHLALVLDDTWHPYLHQQAENRLQAVNIPWLRGFVSLGEGVIGPLVQKGVPGCSRCADLRRILAGRDRPEMWDLMQALAYHGGKPHDPWASGTGLWQMTHLLTAEVGRVLAGQKAHTEGHVYLTNLRTLKTSLHFVLPDPVCPVCGQLPEDTSAAAVLTLQSSPKVGKNSYRCRSMDDLKQVLARDYLDPRTGMMNGKTQDLISPYADIIVNLPLFEGDEGTAGRTHNYAESEMTAILEGLERYGGVGPRGKRTTVHDSYQNLKDHALNPVTVGVHAQEQYARPDFPFREFDPERPIHWVWGYSFLQERPILVPELLAYYSLGSEDGFIYETSNGCALGGSLEEAIFYGIMEVVERDSFLLTWYAQLPVPRIDPRSSNDLELQLMIDRLETVAGYDLTLYDTTLEHGIPSIWAIAKNRNTSGLHLMCAAGAHLDPVRAVKGALHELAGLMIGLGDHMKAHEAKYVQMLDDPFLVRHMEDHSPLYGLPQAEERLKFLLAEDRPLQTFDERFKPRKWNDDLVDDLKDLLQTFRRLNLEVIVVDQTTPEMKRNDLSCVKVLIPGMLPMTFGHHLTRVRGLERVLSVPAELGYYQQPLTMEQLNPHPHPFP